jgi:hypothetical protein
MSKNQITIKIRKDSHYKFVIAYEAWVAEQLKLEPADRAGERLSQALYFDEIVNGRATL